MALKITVLPFALASDGATARDLSLVELLPHPSVMLKHAMASRGPQDRS